LFNSLFPGKLIHNVTDIWTLRKLNKFERKFSAHWTSRRSVSVRTPYGRMSSLCCQSTLPVLATIRTTY